MAKKRKVYYMDPTIRYQYGLGGNLISSLLGGLGSSNTDTNTKKVGPETGRSGEGGTIGGTISGLLGLLGGSGNTLNSVASSIGGSTLQKARVKGDDSFDNFLTGRGGVLGGIGNIISGVKAKLNPYDTDSMEYKTLGMSDMQKDIASAAGIYSNGGLLNRGINEFNVGLSHEQNPNGGIQLGQNNLVEEGETRGFATTRDYIFSDKLKPSDSDKTFADVSKDIEGKYKGYDTDIFALESKDRELAELRNQQEDLKLIKFTNRLAKLQRDFPEQFNQNTDQVGTHQMPDGTIMLGNTHQKGLNLQNQEEYKCGGKLKLRNGGGLSRSEDYGSKKKPYPSVKSSNFAGGGRSYPIPTKADAIDALRLAGLHGRSDVRSKVFKKYPSLKKQYGGQLNSEGDPPYNVLARTDETGVWGNYTLQDPEAISKYNRDIIGNTKYQFGNRWKTLEGIQDIRNRFRDEDFEPFKKYYERGVGSPYDPKVTSPDQIRTVLREAATNRPGKSFPTNEGYGYTGPATIPMLEAYLDQRDAERIIQKEPIIDNIITDNTVTNDIIDDNIVNGNIINNQIQDDNLNIPMNTDFFPETQENLDQFQIGINKNLQNVLGDQNIPMQTGQITSGRPDVVGIAASGIPNLIQALGNRRLAQNLRYPRAGAYTYDPDFVDPTRAAQEVKTAFAGTRDKIRQGSLGRGNYLSNLIGNTAAESRGLANVYSRFANMNANIANQAGQFGASNQQRASAINAQLGLQEAQDIAGLRQNEIRNLSGAASNIIQSAFADKRAREQIAMAGGENFRYGYVGSPFNQKLVKVFKGNGYEYYIDPNTGERININS